MNEQHAHLARVRTRWSAIGAAIAITLGGGGIGLAQASVSSGDKPVTVTVDARRILDTRTNVGLAGGFAKDTPREVQVTGSVDVVTDTGTTKETVVPSGASAVLVNVTVVFPTDQGFLTLRAGGATGAPKTSTVNFAAGSVEPNAATVDLSADGKIQVWVFMPSPTAKADVLIDVVGYTTDHNHDDRYYTETEMNSKLGAKADASALASKANTADVYTKSQVDAAVAGVASGFEKFAVNLTDTPASVVSVTVDVPTSGTVVVTGSLTIQSDSGVASRCGISTSATSLIDEGWASIIAVVGNSTSSLPFAETRAFEVTAGSTTFHLVCKQANAGAAPSVYGRSLTAVFSPNGL